MNNEITNETENSKHISGILKLIETMDDTDRRLISVVLFLEKSIALLSFFVFLLIWRVFFYDATNYTLSLVIKNWGSLSEGYRICILTLIGSIPAGIITTTLSYLFLEKIKRFLKKKK